MDAARHGISRTSGGKWCWTSPSSGSLRHRQYANAQPPLNHSFAAGWARLKGTEMKQNGLTAVIELLQFLRRIDPEFPIQYALCLSEIARHEGLSVTELAQRTGITLSTVSRIVSALSSTRGRYAGLINVRFSRVESRRKELSLTPQGHTVIRHITANFDVILPKKAI